MAYSEAQKRATIKYKKAHTEQITFDVKPGTKNIYKAVATSKGMSLKQYIVSLIEKDMKEGTSLE